MAKRGKRATKEDAWTDDDWQALRRLKRKVGGEELIRRIDACSEPTRGAPRKDFFNSFSVNDGPEGYYTVRFNVSNAYRPFVVIVQKARRAIPGHVKSATLHQTMRKVAEYAWTELGADPRRLGKDIKATAIKLVRLVREAAKGG